MRRTAPAMPLLRSFHGDAFLGGARGAGDGADHRPVVLVHGDRLFRLGPEVDRDVVVAVAEDAGLDGQVAHRLAQPLLAPNGTPFDEHSRRLSHPLIDTDLGAKRVY